MEENPDKQKFKKLEKIYSPRRDYFKLAQNTENRSLYERLIGIISGAKLLCVSTQSLKRISRLFRSLAPVRRKTIIKKALALITIITVIITAYFQNTSPVSAATEAL